MKYQNTKEHNSKLLINIMLIYSLSFLVMALLGPIIEGSNELFFSQWLRILSYPSRLVTDYFNVGGVGGTMFNAFIIGITVVLFIIGTKTKANGVTFACFILCIGHGFFGQNILNMLPFIFGVYIVSLIRKEKLGKNLNLALFLTALGPLASEFIWRYFLQASFDLANPSTTIAGIILAFVVGIIAALMLYAMLPGFSRLHKGYNLYNAGLAIGFACIIINAFFFKSMNVPGVTNIVLENSIYSANGNSYQLAMSIYFVCLFTLTGVLGLYLNKWSLKGFKNLLCDSGHRVDFTEKYGMPLTLINIAFLGYLVLAYFNAVISFTDGVGFTGPTTGVTLVAITFVAAGMHVKNVSPIMMGYILFYVVIKLVSSLFGVSEITTTLSTQGYIIGLALSLGLCPITGHYGICAGILAGFVHACICTTTGDFHGGFVLYNGGFTSGLTAITLVPILQTYFKRKDGKPHIEN